MATPSWDTLQRIAEACGQRLTLKAEVAPDPHDVELAETLMSLSPLERLRSLRRYVRLREMAAARS